MPNVTHRLYSEVSRREINLYIDEFDLICAPSCSSELIQDIKNHLRQYLPVIWLMICELNNAMSNFPKELPFRVVEFGIGYNPTMCICAHILAKKNNLRLQYVGIDINNNAIDTLVQTLSCGISSAEDSLRLICADGSDETWFNNLNREKFNAAVFCWPITEDPLVDLPVYEAMLPLSKNQTHKRRERYEIIHTQYQQIEKLLTEMLPKYMALDSTIVAVTRQPEEYHNLVDLLRNVMPNLPLQGQLPEHQTLLIAGFNSSLRSSQHLSRTSAASARSTTPELDRSYEIKNNQRLSK